VPEIFKKAVDEALHDLYMFEHKPILSALKVKAGRNRRPSKIPSVSAQKFDGLVEVVG
jgi:hypothetical protein